METKQDGATTEQKCIAIQTAWERFQAIERSGPLALSFPQFIETFTPLRKLTEAIFHRVRSEAGTPQIIVFGLGRLCVEDFAEILFLAEHGYGYAAIKLLRGLYERAVVTETIVENPDREGRRFFNYFAVDAMKFQNRAKGVYENRWTTDPEGMKKWFDEVKADYKYAACESCGQVPQQSWTTYGLDALAGNLGKDSADPKLKKLGEQLRKAYLTCAALPNSHIHASMFGLSQRLVGAFGGDLRFKEDSQVDQVEFALSQAHGLFTLVLHTQNNFFNLGMDEQLQHIRNDWFTAWPSVGEEIEAS
jgi:hypothetical protein